MPPTLVLDSTSILYLLAAIDRWMSDGRLKQAGPYVRPVGFKSLHHEVDYLGSPNIKEQRHGKIDSLA
jgi:hypothetical protein